MSRSNYSDNCDGWELIMWRGAVASAIRGKRGQQLLIDLAAALDAMPEKRLITDELSNDGEVCALGALGQVRGIDMTALDPDDPDTVAEAFNVAPALVREITFENDECGMSWKPETPEARWQRMRKWVATHIIAAASR